MAPRNSKGRKAAAKKQATKSRRKPRPSGVATSPLPVGRALLDLPADQIEEYLRRSHRAAIDSQPPSPIPPLPPLPLAASAISDFVELDHNSRTYGDATKLGRDLIEAVRGNNAYAAVERADQEQRIAELEAGYRLLQAPRANPKTVQSVLGGVLTYLIMKFVDQPIGEMAKLAWSALKKLIGLE